MVDPATLEVLTYMYLPVPVDQASSWATAYLYLDNNDRVIMPVVDGNTVKIMVVQTLESAGKPHFEVVGEGYDITSYIGPGDNINGLMADWQGRIWFVVRTAATVGVLDPATGAIKTLALEGSITNGFSMDRDAAYIVTTAKMYRVEAGRDGVPYKVWEEGYENVGFKKPGQLSAGSGTTPTILGNGKYVAITDNADQLHVMVYRTDAQLTPGKQRILCEVPVFKAGAGADENSLIGSGLSLVAYNAYGNDFDKLFVPPQPQKNEPGVARVDIDPNGKGCTKVWENDSVTVSDEVHKLSTKTGLIYAIGRKWDTQVGYSNRERPGRILPNGDRIPHRRGRLGTPAGHRLQLRRLRERVDWPDRNRLHLSVRRADLDQGLELKGGVLCVPSLNDPHVPVGCGAEPGCLGLSSWLCSPR